MAATVGPLATAREQTPRIPGWGELAVGQLLLPLVLVVTFASHALNLFAYPLYLVLNQAAFFDLSSLG